jgi:hypothetical protein
MPDACDTLTGRQTRFAGRICKSLTGLEKGH